MNYIERSQKIAEYIKDYMQSHNKPELVYHNMEHTQRVVTAAMQIADHYQLNEADYFVVTTAAWFHDLGYFDKGAANHETDSTTLATAYLEQSGLEQSLIAQIAACIIATRIPQQAKNLLEEIVCDADLFHLGTDRFFEYDKLLRKEAEIARGIKIAKDEWRAKTIALLQNHQYYTDYCRLLSNDKQQQNLDQLLQKQLKKQPELPVAMGDEVQAQSKGKSKETGRGIETMFRISSANNQRLSDMADNKAHILITVNSIILSVIFSVLLEKLDSSPHLFYPTMLILGTGVTTIVIGILATRPSVSSGKFLKGDSNIRKINLLFFGNFYKMNFDDYASEIWKVMDDRDLLYNTLIRDVYAQGVVLGRKYKLLRLAYTIFMFGLIVSAIAFTIAIIIVH